MLLWSLLHTWTSRTFLAPSFWEWFLNGWVLPHWGSTMDYGTKASFLLASRQCACHRTIHLSPTLLGTTARLFLATQPNQHAHLQRISKRITCLPFYSQFIHSLRLEQLCSARFSYHVLDSKPLSLWSLFVPISMPQRLLPKQYPLFLLPTIYPSLTLLWRP